MAETNLLQPPNNFVDKNKGKSLFKNKLSVMNEKVFEKYLPTGQKHSVVCVSLCFPVMTSLEITDPGSPDGEHCFPSFPGSGLSQVRFRLWLPFASLARQGEQLE